MAVGVLLLRVIVGLTLAAHGAQKLFGWFGGYGLDGTGKFMERLGLVPGRRAALLSGLAELGSGLLLALGLFVPAAAAGVVGVMLVAVVTVHLSKGFFVTNQGFEYNLVIAAAALAVAFTGAGSLSLDALLGLDLGGVAWGVAALAAGLVGGAVQLAQRKPAGSLVVADGSAGGGAQPA